MDTYSDTWIECTQDEVRIRGYYIPWGTKHIPYGAITSAQRVALNAVRGRLRIWGTANPGYWASFDPGRPRKTVGFILDIGRAMKPLVTPDDPDAFEAVLRGHGVADAGPGTGPARAPII